jgi:hypothetical protein
VVAGARGERGGHLVVAELGEQVAAGGQPAARVGDDPAEYLEPVRAAVQRGERFVVAGLGRHQRDRPGRHVGRDHQ